MARRRRPLHLKGDYEKTVGHLERAAAIRPPDTSVLNALGDSHQRLGDEEKANGYFERSLELDPTQDAVKKRLTRMERSLLGLEAARTLLRGKNDAQQ